METAVVESRTNQKPVKDSYGAKMPSTSRSGHLVDKREYQVGYQSDQKMRPRKKQQQGAENQSAKKPIDLRHYVQQQIIVRGSKTP